MPSSIKALIRSFPRDERGNVAMLFGLCMIAVMGIAGLALDYSRQQSTNAMAQTAADQVALALALDAATKPASEIQARAEALFAAAMASQGLSSSNVKTQYVPGDPPTFRVISSGTIPTTFGGLFGIKNLKVSADAAVPVGQTVLEIALVLDNTGSMHGRSKLDELKKASKSLIKVIKDAVAAKGARARISIVPFAQHVNIGEENATQDWLDWNDYSGNKKWSGCVTDRNRPLDIKADSPSGDAYTWYPAVNCSLAQLMPLTDKWSELEARIDSLNAAGMTNLTIGMAWGFNMLTPKAPLSTASEEDKPTRYMIVLTDGMNTRNRWSSDPVQIDARSRQICVNLKAANIKVYTVRVVNGNEALLRECATNPSMYYNIMSASELNAVFEKIAKQMTSRIYLGG